MKKLIPVIYFLIGLALIAQSAHLIPLIASVPNWLPLAAGWCFIFLGVLMVIKMGKSEKGENKNAEGPESEEKQ